MLADLTKDEDTVVATLALENPRCPRTARLLATHSTDLIVSNTALWLLTDPMAMSIQLEDGTEILTDHDYVVHPLCPQDRLDELSRSEEQLTRIKVARHPGCSPATISRLAADPDWEIRMFLARNHSCPLHTLDTLRKDRNRTVRYVARQVIKQKHDIITL